MAAVRFIVGCILGGGAGFGTGFLLGNLILQLDSDVALIVGGVTGVVAAVYSAIAMASKVYKVGFLSILGFIVDVSWSLLNSLAGLAVWIPAALISGANFCTPNDDSQRSGTFVYDKNPRGGNFGATTIGTVIAGGWSSHEEIHVWQARLYGPVYMIIYILSFLFNLLFQLPFRRNNLMMDAYTRICFEEWAYWGGNVGDGRIDWGGWIGGFFLTVLYCGLFLVIPLGIVLDQMILWIVGASGLVLYTIIRAALPAGHGFSS